MTCWGTRGSLPRAADASQWRERFASLLHHAGRDCFDLRDAELEAWLDRLPWPLTYGGETTCTQIDHAGRRLLVDMGSGLRAAGEQILRTSDGSAEAEDSPDHDHHVLLSHLHWDHIMGLPLFAPLHRPGHRLHVHHVHAAAPEHLRLLFNGVNFPMTWDAVAESIDFHRLEPRRSAEVGGFLVTPYLLDHPGDAYGFRVEAGGRSVAIAVDTEATRRTPEQLGEDAKLYRGADLLLIDAQYRGSQLATRTGWGHGSPPRAVELARSFGVPRLWLTHHDPSADDADLDALQREAQDAAAAGGGAADALNTAGGQGLAVALAYDGLRVELPSGDSAG